MTDSKDVFYGTLLSFPPILGVKGSQGSLHCLEITFINVHKLQLFVLTVKEHKCINVSNLSNFVLEFN